MFKVKTRSEIKKTSKKVFQLALIRKVGAGFEISNGYVKFHGSNRARLLEMLDQWESEALKADKASRAPRKPTARKKARKR